MTSHVVLLVGLPGSGKSTLAAKLARRHNYAHIDRDAIRARLFPEGKFDEAEKHAANLAVMAELRQRCATGRGCIVDGMTFGRRAERDAAQSIAGEYGFNCVLLWLDCPAEVAAARVAAQAHPARDRDATLVRDVASRFEAPEKAVHIDATLTPDQVLRLAERALV
jgi:predicted kinase